MCLMCEAASPNRTVSNLPINIQQILDRLQVNTSFKNPIYVDIKSDRARAEDRQHHSKRLKGGYPVERITGVNLSKDSSNSFRS